MNNENNNFNQNNEMNNNVGTMNQFNNNPNEVVNNPINNQMHINNQTQGQPTMTSSNMMKCSTAKNWNWRKAMRYCLKTRSCSITWALKQ